MNRLYEVDVMRTIAIFLVVFTHSYAIYTGIWVNPNESQVKITPFYIHLDKFLVAFRMPVIVFIAGYVFEYFRTFKNQTFKSLVWDKIRRLLLPTFLFGILLIFTFRPANSLFDFIVKLSNGPGHLWFLPMLFWCFIIGFYLLQIKKYKLLILGILYFLGVLSNIIPNFFGISKGLSFLPYFYLGALFINCRNNLVEMRSKFYLVLIALFLFISIFVLNTYVFYDFLNREGIYFKTILSLATYVLRSVGVISFFILILYFVNKGFIKDYDFYRKISKKTFGIYIFHLFILLTLIYKCSFYNIINNYITPFVLFIITSILSILFTGLFLKTRIGKFLIG